jgi:hypothetical protein
MSYRRRRVDEKLSVTTIETLAVTAASTKDHGHPDRE